MCWRVHPLPADTSMTAFTDHCENCGKIARQLYIDLKTEPRRQLCKKCYFDDFFNV